MITCICSFRLSNRTYECIKNPHKSFWLITGVTLFKKNCVWKTRCQGKCSNLYSHEVTALKDTEQIKSRWWSFAVTFIWRTSRVSREEVPWWQVCNSSDGWHAHSATEQTRTLVECFCTSLVIIKSGILLRASVHSFTLHWKTFMSGSCLSRYAAFFWHTHTHWVILSL